MKAIKYIFLSILSAGMVSCADFLDKSPDDQLTLEMVFTDKVRIEGWLANVYNGILDQADWYGGANGYESMGDDLAPQPRWAQFGWSVIDWQTGNWSSSSTGYHMYWIDLPKRIRQALIFIENAKPNEAQLLTQEEVNLMKLECRFLIAYYYWLMAEAYGPVPFNIEITPSSTPTADLMIEQRPFYEIVDWVDKELTELSQLLPEKYSDPRKFGRATSIACLAIRARMRLFAASPLVNGNPMYASFKNTKGENLFSTNYDASRWQKAYEACKELIQRSEAAGHSLIVSKLASGKVDPFQTYTDIYLKTINEGNTELLWARTGNGMHNIDRIATPRGMGGNGGYGVTQNLVDAFFMKNGLPINDSKSGYVEKGFSTETEIRDTDWSAFQSRFQFNGERRGWVTTENTYNMYCNREARFYNTILYNGAWSRSANRNTQFLCYDVDGGPGHDSPEAGYLLRKRTDPNAIPLEGMFKYRYCILFRLGEAYLNLAEAAMETGQLDEAISLINTIRHRAYIPEYGRGVDANGFTRISYTNTKEEVRKLVRMERRVELCCENGITYHDIRRWVQGEERLNKDFYGMNCKGSKYSDDETNTDSYFKRTVYQKRLFDKKNYWYPVPQSEIDKNSNLVQNPYWE